MADKVVQLVDANDDNIFPLSSDPNAAHITMTMTDPGEGTPLGQNEFVAVYGGDPIILDYSADEINTGMKWIDGSTIYKKTINFGTLPNSTSKNVAHGISNFSKIVHIDGITNNGISYAILPMVSTVNFPVSLTVDSANIIITTASDRTDYTESYITLYYTKSS